MVLRIFLGISPALTGRLDYYSRVWMSAIQPSSCSVMYRRDREETAGQDVSPISDTKIVKRIEKELT